MSHIRNPSKFKRSSQSKSNLLWSSKLQRYAKERKKQKWDFINSTFKRTQMPLERLSRYFAFQWNLKQAYKGHFSIQRENKWKNFINISQKRAKIVSTNKIKDFYDGKKELPFETKTVKGISYFMALWESRLDVCLWKSNLLPSISMSRQFISHGLI
jgi:ribosomal protein S4